MARPSFHQLIGTGFGGRHAKELWTAPGNDRNKFCTSQFGRRRLAHHPANFDSPGFRFRCRPRLKADKAKTGNGATDPLRISIPIRSGPLPKCPQAPFRRFLRMTNRSNRKFRGGNRLSPIRPASLANCILGQRQSIVGNGNGTRKVIDFSQRGLCGTLCRMSLCISQTYGFRNRLVPAQSLRRSNADYRLHATPRQVRAASASRRTDGAIA